LIAWIRRWPFTTRRLVLLLGFAAISAYIDFVLLDIDGSQIKDAFRACWTEFDDSGCDAERVAQVAILAGIPVATESVTSDAPDPRLSDHSIRSRHRRILPRTYRVSEDALSSSLSADPA
jgi:hypothetical protein